MRIVAGFLLVAAASVVLMQSSQEFHSRYGEPDMERFTARPGISLAVEYGSDHLACQLLIKPLNRSFSKKSRLGSCLR